MTYLIIGLLIIIAYLSYRLYMVRKENKFLGKIYDELGAKYDKVRDENTLYKMPYKNIKKED